MDITANAENGDWADIKLGACSSGNARSDHGQVVRFKRLMIAALSEISPQQPDDAYLSIYKGENGRLGVMVTFDPASDTGLHYAEGAMSYRDAVWDIINKQASITPKAAVGR